MTMGTAAARKIKPSSQLMANIKATPIATVSAVTTSMIAPNAIQRRMKFKSLMARLSSCPEPQRSWNSTARFCRWR